MRGEIFWWGKCCGARGFLGGLKKDECWWKKGLTGGLDFHRTSLRRMDRFGASRAGGVLDERNFEKALDTGKRFS